MSEMELYGLMAIAKEHQAAVERAQKGLDGAAVALVAAGKGFDQVRAEIRQAATEAVRAAVAGEATALATPLRQAAQEAANAAAATSAAANSVSWAWVLAAFALGVSAGVAGTWWSVGKRLQSIEAAAYATYEQTKPLEKPKGR